MLSPSSREPDTLCGLERIETPFSCVEKAPKFGSILPIVYSHPSIGAANVAATPSPKRIKTEAGQSGSISGSGEGGAGMMPMPDAGTWVKFRGLQPRVFEGQLQCFFVAFSTWTLHVEEGNILRCEHICRLHSDLENVQILTRLPSSRIERCKSNLYSTHSYRPNAVTAMPVCWFSNTVAIWRAG